MEVKPGYKQTEVGVIPEDWDVKTIEQIGFVTSGKRLPLGSSLVKHPTPHPYVRVTDMRPGTVSLDEIQFVPESVFPAIKRYRIYCDDIFISVAGSLGIVGKVPKELDGANLTENADRITKITCSQDYLLHVLMSPLIQNTIDSIQTVGAQPKLALTRIRKFTVPNPPLPEQRDIATALSDVDGLLGGLDRLIAKKRDLKQAAMQQLLTCQTRLPGFHGEWTMNTVAELEEQKLVKLSRGQVISKKDIDNTPGDFPIYSSSIHNDGLFGRYGDFMFDEELITWSVDGGGNFFHRRKHKFSVTNVCGFMRVDASRIDYRFFAAELQLLHSRKSFDYQSKAHPSVVRKEYEVQLPPHPEQAAIAGVLREMDGELVLLEQRREKTRALKQAMMQELLTGRTRLV